MVRAAAASANPSAAVSRRGLASSGPRLASTVPSVSTISSRASGEYGGSPQQAASSSSRTSSSSAMPNRSATSATGARPTRASHPTMASSRRSRWPASSARLGVAPSAAARDRPSPGPGVPAGGPDAAGPGGDPPAGVAGVPSGTWAAVASSHSTRARRAAAGSRTSAWSSRPRIHERMAGGLVTPRRSTAAPSGRRSTTARSPTSSTTLGASMASTARSTSSSAPSPTRHGSSGAAPAGSKPSGTGPLPGAPSRGRPSTRSTRNVRAAERPRSQPTRYQRPSRNHRPPGATVRASPR